MEGLEVRFWLAAIPCIILGTAGGVCCISPLFIQVPLQTVNVGLVMAVPVAAIGLLSLPIMAWKSFGFVRIALPCEFRERSFVRNWPPEMKLGRPAYLMDEKGTITSQVAECERCSGRWIIEMDPLSPIEPHHP